MKTTPDVVHIDPTCQFIDMWPVSFSKKTQGSITYSFKQMDMSEYEDRITALEKQVATLKKENKKLTAQLNPQATSEI